MIYILVPLLLTLVILRQFLPIQWGVHAARANKDVRRSRFMGIGRIIDEHGRALSLSGKFVGKVDGGSMESYGLRDGATFIAEVLDDERRHNLKAGDVVVVDDTHAHSNSGLRLRCVAHVADGKIAFANHADGAVHKARPAEKIKARVEYVVA